MYQGKNPRSQPASPRKKKEKKPASVPVLCHIVDLFFDNQPILWDFTKKRRVNIPSKSGTTFESVKQAKGVMWQLCQSLDKIPAEMEPLDRYAIKRLVGTEEES